VYTDRGEDLAMGSRQPEDIGKLFQSDPDAQHIRDPVVSGAAHDAGKVGG
jgi:hypothetical protein